MSVQSVQRIWTLFQYSIRRLIVRSRKVSKPRDLYLELSDRSEIWQAPRQHCCRCACQISKRCDNLNYQSRGFETSRDLTIRRLIGYWNGALNPTGSLRIFIRNPELMEIFCFNSMSAYQIITSCCLYHDSLVVISGTKYITITLLLSWWQQNEFHIWFVYRCKNSLWNISPLWNCVVFQYLTRCWIQDVKSTSHEFVLRVSQSSGQFRIYFHRTSIIDLLDEFVANAGIQTHILAERVRKSLW